jgi:hypothetical protein
MNQIKKETLNLEIQNSYAYTFEIPADGIYLIEIIASAKSWWQNVKSFKSFFQDDDLAVKIGAIEFPKLNGKRGLFDGEAAWNGKNLKGLSKTNALLIKLEKGLHVLNFLADQAPTLESIDIYQIDEIGLNYVPENNPAQDGNRRQWITLIPVNVSIKKLSIKATAKNYPDNADDDDIKLILDGKIEQNNENKAHKNWFWCGRTLRGQEKEFSRELNWQAGLHYAELWADRMSSINEIKLVLNLVEDNIKKGKIVLHKDIEEADYVNLRKASDAKSESIFQLENGSEVEIIEEIVKGEKIQNYSDIWHKVKYQENEGYILSSFVEINGQERTVIVEKIRTQAKAYEIDENYVIALAGCESKYKPYAVSFSGALGIFQLTSIARDQIREKFNFEISKEESFNVDKNIEAGVIYLKWLFSIYRGSQDEYKKITAAWNAGNSLIPVTGAVNLDKISDQTKKNETQKLVDKVEKNRKNKNWDYILPAILIFLIACSILNFSFHKNILTEKVSAVEIPKEGLIFSDNEFKFINPYSGIKTISINGESPRMTEWYTNVIIEYEDGRVDKKVYPGFLDNAYMFSLYSFEKELFIVRQESRYISTSILRYNEKNNLLEDVKFIQKDGLVENGLCCSYVMLKPLANGVQYDLGVRYFFGKEESTYEYKYMEGEFIETERGPVKEGPTN